MRVMREDDPTIPGDSEGLDEYLSALSGTDDIILPDHQKVKYDNEVLGEKLTPVIPQTTLFSEGNVNPDKVGKLQTKTLDDFTKANTITRSNPSLSAYKALAYGEIVTKAETSVPGVFVKGTGAFSPDDDGSINQDYSSKLKNVDHSETRRGDKSSLTTAEYSSTLDFKIARKHKDGLTGAFKEQAVNAPQLKHSEDRGGIDLLIKSLTLGTSVKLKPYITTFSDGFTVGWNDLNYVGRQDTLKTFKGTTRAGNIAFKLPAYNQGELTANYAKLQSLVVIAGVGSAQNGYISGPFCSITVGRWFKDTPCIFNSIKFDVQMAEYSWDILQQRPQIVDVSMDFVLLGDTTGAPLNSSTNQYFASLT